MAVKISEAAPLSFDRLPLDETRALFFYLIFWLTLKKSRQSRTLFNLFALAPCARELNYYGEPATVPRRRAAANLRLVSSVSSFTRSCRCAKVGN